MRQRGRKSASDFMALAVNGDPPRLTPPEYLDQREQTLFAEIIEACSPRHFAKSDIPLLVSYVQSTLLSRSAVKRATEDPAMLGLWEKATRMQAMLASRLRLTVQSRVDPKTTGRQRPSGLKHPWED
jgi:hypothetical protein